MMMRPGLAVSVFNDLIQLYDSYSYMMVIGGKTPFSFLPEAGVHEWVLQSACPFLVTLIFSSISNDFLSYFELVDGKIISFAWKSSSRKTSDVFTVMDAL